MSDPKALLSSQEFAEKAGVSSSTVSKWLRSGKIKGSKQGGKWMVSADQLAEVTPPPSSDPAEKSSQPAVAAKPETSPRAGKTDMKSYTIEEFSAMTYLTYFGVERYLKEGRLSGAKNASGQWRIDGSNLEKAEIRRLVR